MTVVTVRIGDADYLARIGAHTRQRPGKPVLLWPLLGVGFVFAVREGDKYRALIAGERTIAAFAVGLVRERRPGDVG